MGDNKQAPSQGGQGADGHAADMQGVTEQNAATDSLTALQQTFENMPFFGSVRFTRSSSDFEGYELNTLVDMVEQTKPEHLENAGSSLWNARDAINRAADSLRTDIGNVDWVGESGDAFRTWGKKLVTYTEDLASFAHVVGDQITAAGTGLASVVKSMPPRDNRVSRKKPEDIPPTERTAANEEYQAALQTEKNRQEAINQMNRLASFYAVSRDTLAQQEPPVFEMMPDVGVPAPTRGSYEPGPSPVGPGHAVGGTNPSSESADYFRSDPAPTQTHVAQVPSSDGTPPLKEVGGSIVMPSHSVGTEIDSVGTLPPQEVTRPVPPVAPPSQAPVGPGIPPPPIGPTVSMGSVPPRTGGLPVRTGPGGFPGERAPISAQGRPGPGVGGTDRSRTGPVGQPGPVRRGTAPGPGGLGTKRPVTGMPGRVPPGGQTGPRGGTGIPGARPVSGPPVSGGKSRQVGGQPASRTSGPRGVGAGPANGVTGGRPVRSNVPGGRPGSTVPRGTVVGAEGQPGARTPGAPTQRGVVGAPAQSATTQSRQGGRPAGTNPDGVVGTPSGRASSGRDGCKKRDEKTDRSEMWNRDEQSLSD